MGWVRRLRNTILSSKVDEQFEEEARFHLEQRTEEYVRSGMTIAEAQREARRRLGNLTLAKEWARDVDTFRWLEDCRLDLQYAFRTLRTSPGFTAVALLSLGLGIGANTAIFSLLDAVLLKSLPVKNPEELVVLRTGDFSYPAFQAFRRENNAFVDLFATSGITEQNVELGHAMPERTSLSLVSGSYFMVLGVSAIAGRTFTADDDRVPGGEPLLPSRATAIGNAGLAAIRPYSGKLYGLVVRRSQS